MSYPIEASEAPRSRPGTVMFARLLAFAVAALIALAGVGVVVTLSDLHLKVVGTNPQQLTDADLTRVQHILVAVVAVVVALLVAAQLTVAFLLGAPRNGARIMAWVVDGLVVLCCGCGLGNALVQGTGNRQATSGNASVEISTADIPAGLDVLVSIALLFAVLAALTLVVLLALPASNDYFRPAPVMWTPGSWPGGPPGGPGGRQFPQSGQYPQSAPPPGGDTTGWQPPTLPPIGAPPPPTAPPPTPPPPAGPPPAGPPPPPAAPPPATTDRPLPPPHVSPPDDRLRPPPPPTDPTAPPSDRP